jgi:hypothetical protein
MLSSLNLRVNSIDWGKCFEAYLLSESAAVSQANLWPQDSCTRKLRIQGKMASVVKNFAGVNLDE